MPCDVAVPRRLVMFGIVYYISIRGDRICTNSVRQHPRGFPHVRDAKGCHSRGLGPLRRLLWYLQSLGAVLAPTLRRLGLDMAPLQSAWVLERTNLPLAVLLEDLRLLHADGRLTSGADVYRFVMRRRWWAYPLYLLSIMPGGRYVFDSAYRNFARHRLEVSAACGLVPPAAHDD